MSQGHVSPRLVVAGHTDPGQRRALNEDAWRVAGASAEGDAIVERGYLFAVADGMGGHAAGEVASQIAIEALFAGYYASADASPMSPAMRLEQAILAANARIHAESGHRASQAGMGTTIVAAVVHDKWLTVANVGDSRAYLIRRGATQQITHDHSWVAEQVAAGLLTEEQAQNHTYRSVVTRCLGHQPQIAVDTFELVLEPGDQVLLCSDGLSNQVSEGEMVRIATDAAPQRAVRELVDLANRYGGPDNITAVLLEVVDEAQAAARAERRRLAQARQDAAHAAVVRRAPAQARRGGRKWALPLSVLVALCLVGTALVLWGPDPFPGWLIQPTPTQTAAP
ncbi:MAG: Stp1/IreP family PP2C-type Ser/Thr phosphatase, partial [Anaerolineae bacterium]|nr:Stp1/IreP family PP2C-type Ser/Thr phosphatase [Anaerolineae bacterium]